MSSISLSPGNLFAGAPIIANGDPVIFRELQLVNRMLVLQVCIIGYNYVKITPVNTNVDNTIEYELKSADTLSYLHQNSILSS